MARAAAEEVRAFNRFYSQVLGGTSRSYLDSGLTLPEARVLFEVGAHRGTTAQAILARVAFDQGHLSRIVARLLAQGFLRSQQGPDRRTRTLSLTPKGRRMYGDLDSRADREAAGMLAPLTPDGRARALASLQTLRGLLGDPSLGPVRIRDMRPGDLGWAFLRQAETYRHEFGYSQVFETYVARGLPPFLDAYDAAKDRLWVAVRGEARVGCIAIQHDPDRPGWAKLRWYFVEAEARGSGTGGRLLATALRFCRTAGYAGVYLWTVDDLAAARRMYERAGFELAHQDPAPCAWAPWGHEQRWELRMGPARRRASAA